MEAPFSTIRMPQLPEAWDQTDDWTGTTSATERRRRQNRLNQRAHRKRRHYERVAMHRDDKVDAADLPISIAPNMELIRSGAHLLGPLITTLKDLPILLHSQRIRCPTLRRGVVEFLRRAAVEWFFNRPRLSDLPTLTRLNALDALLRNALVLHIPFEFLESDDYSSPFNSQGPRTLNAPLTLPAHLRPTTMQRAVTHHSWLDLFPIPGMRDNILRGIQSGQLDEDQLCNELCCDLLNLRASAIAPLVIWGDTWDVTGWEFSIHFFERWGMLLEGCPEVLQATNHWREERGEEHIEL